MIATRNNPRRPIFVPTFVLPFALAALALLSACQQETSAPVAEAPATEAAPTPPDSWLITNVIVLDGTGAPGSAGAVRISGDTITEVGQLTALPGETVVDGGGQVLAPGFIDTHSHVASDLADHPEALAAVSQGITTIIAGQDGSSHFPLSEFQTQLAANPAALNVASYSGHNTIREKVLGDDFRRSANDGEVERMQTLLQEDMDAGALGLATGLEYDPGIYSDPSEILQLAKLAAQNGGRYISHMRSEDRYFEKALEEIIEIGRVTGMPVQISHFKLAMKRLWGTGHEVLAQLDAARADGIDITADVYPYEYWGSNLMVLLPGRDVNDRSELELAVTEIAPPEGFWLTQFDPQPEYVGKTLAEISVLRNTDPATALHQLITESEAMTAETGKQADAMIGTSMIESDILTLLKWPHTNVCTDGDLESAHPRSSGTYPRILGRYVRELHALTLEDAIHKMTGLAAAHMGISNRGLIQPGMKADLVVFDPATVIDHATPQDSKALSTGITEVWVNGVSVFSGGATSGNLPGVFILREKSSS